MLRIIKQIFFGVLLGLFLLMAVVFGYFYFNQDKIISILIDEVNRQVNTQVDVENVHMSFWERFPQISIKFEQVIIHNADTFKAETNKNLLETDYIYFDLDLKTLISDKPQINRITIGAGHLNIMEDNAKKGNYNILKTVDEGGGEFEIGNLEIEELNLLFESFSTGQHIVFLITKADINVKLDDQLNAFDINATIQNPSFIPKKYNYFNEYSFVGEVSISNSRELTWLGIANFDNLEVETKGQYEIIGESLAIETSAFKIPSELIYREIKKLDLPVKTANSSIRVDKLIFISNKNNYTLDADYTLSGVFDVNEKFNSININTSGSAYVDNKKTILSFNKLRAAYENSKASFSGSFNTKGNKLSGNLSFRVQAQDFNAFLSNYNVANPKGILDGNFQLDQTSPTNIFAFKKGEIGLTNISFSLIDNYLNIEDVQGLLYFSEDEILIETFNGIINKNDVQFSGITRGLQKYFFDDGILNISGDIYSNEFYLSDFLYASPDSKTGTLQLDKNLNLMLDVIVKDIRNNNFRGDNLSLKLNKQGHEVKIENFDIKTSQGHLSGKGVFIEQNNGEWYTSLATHIQQIEIRTFFAQMNEFGQQYIVSDNLKGMLTADINADFVFSPDFNVRTESIYLNADIEINDGELINYKTLEELSDFISIDELKHIKFENLKNKISIYDNKIVIPQMQIRSSAIDIGLVGEHSFNNNIDYQVSVGLSDVLFGKMPRRLRKESKRQKNKKLTLFVDISGNINDPDVSVSKISREKVIEPKKENPDKKKFNIEFDDL